MPSQDELQKGIEWDLFEASLDEATIRERNNPAEQIQRTVITDRGSTTPYKIQALLQACVHGMLDEQTKTPASLIVVDYSLKSLKEGSCFISVDTSFTFTEYERRTETAELASPDVIAYAPFDKEVRYNKTTVDERTTAKKEVEISPEVEGFRVGKAALGEETESTHGQQYFDKGIAGRHFEEGRAYVVYWNLMHNRSQNLGVSSGFRVAILVERKSNVKFQAKFDIVVKSGFGYSVEALKDKWLRKTAIDDPIIFDPSKDIPGSFKGLYNKNKLGELKKRNRLNGLTHVWGLEPLQSLGD